VNIVEKDLEYYINLVDKAVAGFERIGSNFERSSIVGNCYQTASHATEKSFVKGRVSRFGKLHCCLILRNCHSHRNLQQPPSSSVSSHQHRGRTLHQQKDYDSLKAQMMVSMS
jgi:hypothetical protein